jgi:hypothetical protein
MTAYKTDANHAQVAAVMRVYGAYVHDVSQMRPSIGFDLLAARDGRLYLVEVKRDDRAKLTPKEKIIHHAFEAAGVTIHRVETPDDVARMFGLC